MKTLNALKQIAIIIAVLCVLGFIIYYFFAPKKPSIEKEISSATLKERIEQIGELASVSYYYTEVGKFEKQYKPRGWNIPFSTAKLTIAYNGLIKIGVDINQTEIIIEGNVVKVHIPQAKILSNEIDATSADVLVEEEGIFVSDITAEETNTLLAEVKNNAAERAIKLDLLKEAQNRCGEFTKGIIQSTLSEDMQLEVILLGE